jgi:cell wall-associated NlpC family hydrolase
LSQVQRLLRFLLCGAVVVGMSLPAVVLPSTAALAEPSAQEVEEQLQKAHDELEDVIEDHNRITEELKATQAAAAALSEKLAPLQAQLDAAQAGVTKIATTAYKTGGGLAAASFMLGAGSSNTVVHQVESMDRLARSRQREISTYSQTKEQFEREKKRLDDLIAAQTQQQKQLADRRAKIETELKRLEQIERRLEAAGRPRPGAGTPAGPAPTGSGKGAVAVRYAYAQLGKMYSWGAAGPNNFDCSGLTMMAWKAAGVNLPHNAAMQYRATAKVSRSALQPGDLVYYRNLGHVGIYIGNNQIIHASRTGRPVAVASLTNSPPYGYSRPG